MNNYFRMLSQALARSLSWIINHGPRSCNSLSDHNSSPSFSISSVIESAMTCWSSRRLTSPRRSCIVLPCVRRSMTRYTTTDICIHVRTHPKIFYSMMTFTYGTCKQHIEVPECKVYGKVLRCFSAAFPGVDPPSGHDELLNGRGGYDQTLYIRHDCLFRRCRWAGSVANVLSAILIRIVCE